MARTRRAAIGSAVSIWKSTSSEDKSDALRRKEGDPSTPCRKRLRSDSAQESPEMVQSTEKPRSLRRCLQSPSNVFNGSAPCSPKSPTKCLRSPNKVCNGTVPCSPKSPRRRLVDHFPQKAKWNPRDPDQMKAVKEAFHISSAPPIVVCREKEQKAVLEFCKACIRNEKAGSLYMCGCPGTGKTLSIEKVKEMLLVWIKEVGLQLPEILAINSTTLSKSSLIFSKIIESCHLRKLNLDASSPLQHLQNLYSQAKLLSPGRMMLVIVDEMDYLITKDKQVLHDLFMLTTFPFSRLVLIGIANAIDLAERFLPGLESLNCKPKVVTFRAYSKDEICKILQQRLAVLGYEVFQPAALEFCARKVAAASGDMRRALGACMSAIEVFEADLKDPMTKLVTDNVSFDHMDIALSKAFKSPVVDTIQCLPQHQQIILCSLVKLLRTKKTPTIGELNKSYSDTCKATQVPAVGTLEFSNMCHVLNDQGLLKLKQSRQEKLKQVTLTVDCADVSFALKGIRFFRNCLE